MSRLDVPPPGKAKPFDEWAFAIVAAVRGHYLPDARAVRKGSRLVIIRHGAREARLSVDGSSCWIRFTASTAATTMASLFDDRRDDFTVNNLAHTILMRVRNLVSRSHRNPFSYRDSPCQPEQRKRAVSHADHDELRTTRDFVTGYSVFRRSSKHEHRSCPDAVDGVHRDDPRSNEASEDVAGIREESASLAQRMRRKRLELGNGL
jgi:hypothetical protein